MISRRRVAALQVINFCWDRVMKITGVHAI
jgi:hypothetical protein